MSRLHVAKYSQNIDNTGSPEYKKPSKTFVRPEWKGKKKLKIKAGSQNLDPLSIPYCVNRNKDAFCCLLDPVTRSLIDD